MPFLNLPVDISKLKQIKAEVDIGLSQKYRPILRFHGYITLLCNKELISHCFKKEVTSVSERFDRIGMKGDYWFRK